MSLYNRPGGGARTLANLLEAVKALTTDVRRLQKDANERNGGPLQGGGTQDPESSGGGGGNYYTATLSGSLSSGSTASATLKYGPSGSASGTITVSDRESRIPSGSSISGSATVDVAKMGSTYQLVGWSCSDMS